MDHSVFLRCSLLFAYVLCKVVQSCLWYGVNEGLRPGGVPLPEASRTFGSGRAVTGLPEDAPPPHRTPRSTAPDRLR